MPITPNTQPEVTVDKNGKTTTVHRKSGAGSASSATKPTRSVPSPVAASAVASGETEEVPTEQFKSVWDVKVGDIVWDGESGFVVSAATLRGMPGAVNRNARAIAFESKKGDFWYVDTKKSVLVLRDAEALAAKSEEADQGWY